MTVPILRLFVLRLKVHFQRVLFLESEDIDRQVRKAHQQLIYIYIS
jgi:hypothetical protein